MEDTIKKKKSVYYWLRVIHDMSQEEVAEKLLISKSYVRMLEAGDKTPSKRLLLAYSELFGIDKSVIEEMDALDKNIPTKQFLLRLFNTMETDKQNRK